MQKHFFVFIGVLFLLTSCGPTKDDAISFNDRIISDQKIFLKAKSNFYDVGNKLNPDDIKKAFEDFETSVTACVSKIEKTETHGKFDAYKQSAANLLNAYKDMLNKNFIEEQERFADKWNFRVEKKPY